MSVAFAVPGYKTVEKAPTLNTLETREALSQAALDGFFAIADRWQLSIEQIAELLGGISRSSVYKMKTAAGTLTLDQFTRISSILGIHTSLWNLFPDGGADSWMTTTNDLSLFRGESPLNYVLQAGIPGLIAVRDLLNAEEHR